MSNSTELRRITLVGPRLASPAAQTPTEKTPTEKFAWETELSVAYRGPARDDRSLVNSTLGLRVLLQDSTTHDIEVKTTGVDAKVRLHAPRLLAASVHARQHEGGPMPGAPQGDEPSPIGEQHHPSSKPWWAWAVLGVGLLIAAVAGPFAALSIAAIAGLYAYLRPRRPWWFWLVAGVGMLAAMGSSLVATTVALLSVFAFFRARKRRAVDALPQASRQVVRSRLMFQDRLHQYELRALAAGSDPEGAVETGDVFTVAVTPVDPWPTPQLSPEIAVPRFTLAEHRVRVLVSAKGGTPKHPLGFLGLSALDSSSVAAFLPKATDRSAGLDSLPRLELSVMPVAGPDGAAGPFVALDLTPDGIELQGTMANPLRAFDAAAPKRLNVIVRLVHALDPLLPQRTLWSLELVREVDASQRDGMGRQIRGALDRVRAGFVPGAGKPIFVDIDTYGSVPPVRWPLEQHDDGTLALPHDGSEEWRLWVDAQAADARLTGAPFPGAELPSVVMVVPDRVEVVAARNGVTVTLDADRRPVDQAGSLETVRGPHVDVTWKADSPVALELSNDGSENITWFFDEGHWGRELVQRYKRAGVHPPAARTTYLFVPIVGGWLQLPIDLSPKDPADECEPSPPLDPSGGARSGAPEPVPPLRDAVPLGGAFEMVIPPPPPAQVDNAPTGRRLTVSAADYVFAQATFIGGEVKSIRLKLRGAFGAADGILWSASSSPSAEEVLPSLAAGPVSLVGPRLQFGRPTRSTRNLATIQSTSFSPGMDLALTLPRQVGATAYVWQGYGELPLITAAPLTRTSMGSGLPSQTRGLLCRVVDRAGQEITLTYANGASAPVMSVLSGTTKRMPHECPLLEPTAQEAIPLVAVTAAGIEFKPAVASFAQLQARLSYGLPVLDDYFANVRLPETAAVAPPETAIPEPPAQESPTSLDMIALPRAWQRAVDRLDLSRVQASIAFPFRAQASSPVEVENLFGRAAWTTTFRFDPVATIDGRALAFGSYWLGDVPYSGEAALHGLTGHFELGGTTLTAVSKPTEQTLPIVGFAAAAWKDPANGMWRDSRAALTAEMPTTAPLGARQDGLVLRQGQVLGSAGTTEYWLATAAEPVSIEPPPGNPGRELALWFRDLPLQLGSEGQRRFAPSADDIELAIGPLQSAFDAERLPLSLYEWRLCNDAAANTSGKGAALYDIGVGPFRFRPLRLFAVSLGNSGGTWAVSEATIIGSLTPPGTSGLSDDQGPFGPEADYRTGNLVAVTLGSTSAHRLTFRSAKWQKASVTAASVGLSQESSVSFRRAGVPVRLGSDPSDAGETTLRLDLAMARDASDGMLTFDSAAMEAVLFGRRVRYTGGVVAVSDETVTATFSRAEGAATSLEGSGVVLDKISLIWPSGGEPRMMLEGALHVAAVDARLVGPASEAREVVWHPFGGVLSWLNLEIPSPRMRIDHRLGVLDLDVVSKVGQKESRQPIAGLTAQEPWIQATLVMATEPGGQKDPSSFVFRSRSGFGALSLISENGPLKRLDHVLVVEEARDDGAVPVWTSRIEVDLALQAHESRIHWPVGSVPTVVQPPGKAQDIELGTLASHVSGRVLRGRFQAYEQAPVLMHSLTMSISGQAIPTGALGVSRTRTGRRVALAAPWRFVALVTHTLKSQAPAAGQADDTLSWTTLDHVTAVDAHGLVREAHAASTLPLKLSDGGFAFAARYKSTDLASESKSAIKGGLVLQAFAQAGFPVEALARHIADGMFDEAGAIVDGTVGDGIIVTGAGVTSVATAELGETAPSSGAGSGGSGGSDSPGRDRDGVLLVLPWLTTMDRDFDFGPLQSGQAEAPARKLAGFLQAPRTGVAEWDAPDVDWAAGSPMPLARGVAPEVSPASGAAAELAGMLERMSPGGSAMPPQTPVEQVFLRRVSGSAEVTARPIWLRTLLALRAVHDSRRKPIDVTMLVPVAPGRTARFRLMPISPRNGSRSPGAAGRLFAIDRASTRWEQLPPGLFDAAPGFKRARQRAHLVARAEGLVKEPVAIVVVAPSRDALESVTPWRRIDAPFDLDESILDIPATVDASDRLYASPALGWPTSRGTGLAASGALGQGDDFPFQDLAEGSSADPSDVKTYGSGLSGRVTSLSLPGRADRSESPGSTDAGAVIDVRSPVFLALGRKMIFERPASDELPLVAPPARHLSPTEARVVVPVARDLSAALSRVVRGQAAPIVPPFLERASLGLRPGAMAAEFDMLLFTEGRGTDIADEELDASFPRFGRPGHAGPRLLRQHRPPRAPALPRVPAAHLKSHGRRTFVELDELCGPAGDQTVRPYLLLEGIGTVLRRATADHVESFRIRVLDLPLLPSWDRVLRLHLSSPGHALSDKALPALATSLATLGVLRSTGAGATLSVDGRAWRFTKAHWAPAAGDAGQGIVLSLSLRLEDSTDIYTALDAVGGDSKVFLTFRCAQDDASALPPPEHFDIQAGEVADLVPETQRHFSLRLPVRPGTRPSLRVESFTLVFADPSYDRELSGPGALDTQRDAEGIQWKLALDRQEYGVDTPVYFAVGPIDPTTGRFDRKAAAASATVTFLRQPAPVGSGGLSEPQDLKASSNSGIDIRTAYGITLDRLHSTEGSAVVFADGDEIVVKVTVSVGEAAKLSLSVRARVVARPVIAPPPAVYALVVPEGETGARVALHATAPLPQVVDFPDLADDLAVGHVRRSALFVWPLHVLGVDGPRESTLVKVDRAGGAQIPDRMTDLQPTEPIPM